VQPGTTDAVQFYSAAAGRAESGDYTGVTFTTLGNRNLKPERSTEIEVGIDGTFFNSRLTTEITYYSKSSKDALVSRVIPPSIGIGNTTRFENLGEVTNKGVEALINARIIERNAFGWDVTLNASANANKLVTLGGVPTIVSSSTLQQREGYPLNGWWSRGLLGFDDKNGDGIIANTGCAALQKDNTAACEILVSDTAIFLGYGQPKQEAALTSGFDLFSRRLRVSAMFDYKGGHKNYNNTERIRCASRFNCAGLLSKDASLFQQARTVMVREHASRSVGGFIEDGDFVRFRELSLSYTAPNAWASRYLRGRSLVASFAVRNIHTVWTKYTGVDPEAFGTNGDGGSEFQAFAPPTYLAFRLNLGF
jgi:hypothetical protein